MCLANLKRLSHDSNSKIIRNLSKLISCHWPFSIPAENIRKPQCSYFITPENTRKPIGLERDQWHKMD